MDFTRDEYGDAIRDMVDRFVRAEIAPEIAKTYPDFAKRVFG